MSKNMFEVATREKMRFPFKGMISVEDLWDLSVQNLDKVFKALNYQRKEAQEESLLNVKSSEDEVLDTQIAIVKYIVGVKLEEQAARVKAAENKEKKQKTHIFSKAKHTRHSDDPVSSHTCHTAGSALPGPA